MQFLAGEANRMCGERVRTHALNDLAGLCSLAALSSHVLVHLSQGTSHYMHFIVEAVGAAGAAVAIGYSEKSKGRRQ